MNARARAKEIVYRIVEAERMGGGFRSYFETATNLLAKIIADHDAMTARVKALELAVR